MAINRDTSGQFSGGVSGSGTLTFTQAITLGSATALYIAATANSGSGVTITSVTYNGVAMTQMDDTGAGSNRDIAWYVLGSPASGTNNVIITFTSSGASSDVFFGFESFSGTFATTALLYPAKKKGYTTGGTITLTTIYDKSWLLTFGNDFSSGGTWSAGTGATLRQSGSGSTIAIFDSNGPLPIGSNSMTITAPSGSGGGDVFMVEVPLGIVTINVSDSTAVSETAQIQGVLLLGKSDSTGVTDPISIIRIGNAFAGITASVITSAYKWLTSTLLTSQKMFTVQPYFSLKILDDTVQPNQMLIPSGAFPLGRGAMATCPDGSVVAAGFDGANGISFWKASNLHASAGIWDTTTSFESASSGIDNAQNRVDISVSDFYNGSYEIDVFYFSNFTNSSSSINIILQRSQDGGATWNKITFSSLTMDGSWYVQPPFIGNFTRNLCLAAMKPRLVGGIMQSGVMYIKPFTTSLESLYAGYDIWYITYTTSSFSNTKWAPTYLNSTDWTLHSLTCYYLNGKDYVLFSGFRNFLDPPNTVYNDVEINGVTINGDSGNYVGGNYGLWVASLDLLTNSVTTDIWSPPRQVFTSISDTFVNQNEFVFPVANVFNGVVNAFFRAYTVASVATGASGSVSQTVTTSVGYMLTTSVDGYNFTYPSPVVFSDGTLFTDISPNNPQTWVSYVGQGNYYYTGGSGVIWEFVQNNITADVSNDVLNYSIQDAAGQPSSISITIGNANGKWVSASPTGTGASAIASNRKILLEQGFYNATKLPETAPRNVYYIDDVQQSITGSQNTATLLGRDFYKKLKILVTKYAFGRTGPYFYTDIFDGSTLNNWSQVSGAWQENSLQDDDFTVNYNTLVVGTSSTDSILTLSNVQTPQWGSELVVFLDRNVGGITYVYPMYIDQDNWLRISFTDGSGAWSVDRNIAGSQTNMGSGPFSLDNGYCAMMVRQYDYYKFNFIMGNNGAGNVINGWGSSVTLGGSGGEFDMTPYVPFLAATNWTVGLGGNGGSNTGSVGTAYGAHFQYFSYAQYHLSLNASDMLTWIGAKTGITQYNFQQTIADYFFDASTYTGTFTTPNRTLTIGSGNSAINNVLSDNLGNAEVQFQASLSTANGFSFLFRADASTPTAAYYFHVLSSGGFTTARFERLYSSTRYIFPSTSFDTASSPQMFGSLNFDLTKRNTYRVVFVNGWLYGFINDIMVAAYNDNNTTVAYLTSGYWGFQADAGNTLAVYYVKVPAIWKPSPTITINPGDDFESSSDAVIQGLRGWYFSDLLGRFKAILLNPSDPSTYTYNPQLYAQNVDNSDKEYVSEVTVYGTNVSATAQNTNLMAGAMIRPMVIVDYTITTQQDAQARANAELINANQYQNQYTPTQTMNVGAELFDPVTVTNTGGNTSGVSTVTRTYAQTLTEGGAGSEYSIGLDTGNM